MIDSDKRSNIFFIILFFLFIYSVFSIYYKYIFLEDFHYFLTEEELPNQFDLSTYPE